MPSITEADVLELLKTSYNIIPDSMKEIGSYFNTNYLITINTSVNEKEGNQFLVKITNTSAPSYLDNVGLQHSMMTHLCQSGVKSIRAIPALDGETFVETAYEGDTYMVQVLTFLEGFTVHSAVIGADQMMKLAYKIGGFLGQFHESMKSLKYSYVKEKTFPFFPEDALLFMKKICYVEDIQVRTLIEKYMSSYQENFLPSLHRLRKGYIHTDFSDTNIIVKASSGQIDICDELEISGIVDFEHCHYGYLVGDVGICIAYHMTKSISIPDSNPVLIGREIIRGYLSISELNKTERDVILEVIFSRLCVSYILASYESFLRPENKEYIFQQSSKIPAVFRVLESMTRSEIVNVLFDH